MISLESPPATDWRGVIDMEDSEEIAAITKLYNLLDMRKFDKENPPAKPIPILKIAGQAAATEGNLVAILAQAKAGKSAFMSACMASLMEPTGDCLGVEGINTSQGAIVHFDTEQSRYDHYRLDMAVLSRAGKRDAPKYFRSYCLTDIPMAERQAAVEAELERAKSECGRICAVFIDGVADLCGDPNDSQESFALIEWLHRTAIEYQCSIVCALHENPSITAAALGKMRGHLGSQLERKAETNIRLEKDSNGIVVVYFEKARHGFLLKQNGLYFQWSDSEQMHVSIDAVAVVSSKRKPKKTKEDVLLLMPEHEPIEKKVLISQLRSNGFAKDRIEGFIGELLDEKSVILEERERKGVRPAIFLKRVLEVSAVIPIPE